MKTSSFLLMMLLLMRSGGAADVQAQNIGDPAPDFTYTDLNQMSHTLSAYSGKVVFLFLFGNGCPFCKAVGPSTESQVQQVFGSNPNFQALGLDLWNSSSSAASVGAFQAETGITYPLCLMAGEMTSKYSTTYDRVIVVAPDGTIAHKSNKNVSSDLNSAVAVIQQLLTTVGMDDPEAAGQVLVSYPNPARDQTTLSFNLNKPADTRLRIFNALGKEVRDVLSKSLPAGMHQRTVDLNGLSKGVYLVRLQYGPQTHLSKLIIK